MLGSDNIRHHTIMSDSGTHPITVDKRQNSVPTEAQKDIHHNFRRFKGKVIFKKNLIFNMSNHLYDPNPSQPLASR
jgi:hypothetical protein